VPFDPFQAETKEKEATKKPLDAQISTKRHRYLDLTSFEAMKSYSSLPFSLKPISVVNNHELSMQ
jgi:hypothetical protein